jgi:G3E family GTPase
MAGSAVLINEFGAIGLDHLLVEKLDEDAVLLNAGCLCCTIRGDLQRALRDLALKAEAGQEIRRVLIETTGLADPAPILQTLMSDPVALRSFRLDGVVTLVDAVLGAATLDSQIEAVKQAAVADRLILSKTDIAQADKVSALEARLRTLNPGAPIKHVVAGDLAPDFLFGAGGFDPARKIADVADWLAAEAAHHHHHHHHDPNRHDARIQAFGLTFADPLPWEGLAGWLEMLAITRGASILRIKGILNLEGEDRPVVLHGVQHVFHPPERLTEWPKGHDRQSRLVFILRDLDRTVVEEGLAAFLQAARDKAAIAAGAA